MLYKIIHINSNSLSFMQIVWKGQSCFQIITNREKNNHGDVSRGNNQVSIIIDPYGESTGLRIPKLEADILLITHDHPDHNNVKAVSGNYFLISEAGEYEIKDVFIQGIPAFHDSACGTGKGEVIIYTLESEGIRICHLGDLGQKELTEDQVEKIGQIDILMIPVGGVYTISSKEATKIIAQIEPRIVIPMHYHIPKMKIKLEGLEKFLKAMGVKSPEILNKLTVKKKDIPEEGMEIKVLKI
jgi:L-ascorbate metabolism protein UlaG (beta-lactamase superfamily)